MGRPAIQRSQTFLENPDITVIGGGPIGCLAALCLGDRLPAVVRLRLITGRRLPPEDGRAAAIIGRSMGILDDLGLGDAFRQQGAALAGIRIIDVTGRLVRAATTTFMAKDVEQDAFGFSLTTRRIVMLLREALLRQGRVEVLEADITSLTREENGFLLQDDNGKSHLAPFVVAADGQRSLAREAAGIAVKRWTYPQVALTFMVTHTRDHDDISTEFHTANGPFTLVPAGHNQSTVVWMTSPERAEQVLAMDEVAFAREAERICRSMLGKFTLVSPRGSYPMGGFVAERFTAEGIALVGETGHAFPPIGAQGMNLGFRDCDTLADACKAALERTGTKLDAADLAAWDHARARDVNAVTAGVDAFNRSLLSDFLPVSVARSAGLSALQSVPPLKRALMRAGLAE